MSKVFITWLLWSFALAVCILGLCITAPEGLLAWMIYWTLGTVVTGSGVVFNVVKAAVQNG